MGLAVGLWLAWWAGSLAGWLLLAGSVSGPEVVAGVVAASIAATGVAFVRARDEAAYTPTLAQARRLLTRLPGRALRDCALVFFALPGLATRTAPSGRMHRIPFDPGQPDNPLDASRRALVVAGISFSPNSVVVRLEPDAGALLEHTLVPSHASAPEDREWPL